MGPLEILHNQGMEGLGRYYGTYRAVVLDNVDKTNTGKILIAIPHIQTGIQVWASPKSIGGGLSYGFKYLTPPKGEFVWVEFEYGDPARPVWSYHPWARGEMPPELQSPDVIGLVTPKGHYITLNEAAEEDEDILTIQLEEGMSIKAGLEKFSLEIPEGVTVVYSKEEGTKIAIQDGSTLEITKDEILFNGGDNGGLVNIQDLVTKLNNLEKDINNLKSIFGAWKPVPSDGGAALLTSLTTAGWLTKTLSITKQSDLEDTKVKH